MCKYALRDPLLFHIITAYTAWVWVPLSKWLINNGLAGRVASRSFESAQPRFRVCKKILRIYPRSSTNTICYLLRTFARDILVL